MKILICGLGSIGQRHARNLISLGYTQLYALRLRNWPLPKELSQIKSFFSLEEALKLSPEVTFITNPTSLHIKYALEFAKIGSHLFIEKPLSDSINDIDKLEKIIEQKKLTAMVGYNFRFHPQLIKIKDLIFQNKIGKIVAVSVMMGEYLPNWHPTEDYRKEYSARSDLGGGVILTQSHDLYYLYWLMGDVVEVFAQAGKFSNLEIDVEDTAQILLKFKSGMIGSLHLDYLQDPPIKQLTIIGTKGKIVWDYYQNYFEVVEQGKMTRVEGDKNFGRYQMFIDEFKNFFGCISKKQTPAISLNDGKRILEICLAAKKSAKGGVKVLLS